MGGGLFSLAIAASQELNFNFTYSGFRSTNLSLGGLAELTSNGLLRVTNGTKQRTSHAFYPNPVTFKNSINSTGFTFSTTFGFAIIPEYPTLGGHGIAFGIAPTRGLPGALPSQYLGLFNKTNNGNQTNHVVAVELDTIYSTGFNDIDDNHVGIDINVAVSSISYSIRRTRKFAEVLEDWELDYGPHRFKFKDLYTATKGFRDEELLGSGGFGRVYKGVLPTSKIQIAVKRVSHESRQGMREFVAEIVSIGRLRHRNLVPLLGYCRRKGELLLVYDYMPNGSLDKYLYDQPTVALNWSQRFRVIKGVASGLLYLHEEWEQVVVHRDVKASNVLLDGELNGRLGDFGLARLYDHVTDPQTTHVVGTLGYLAPEHARTGKATTSTDVFAFGASCLRRPIQPTEDIILVDWVFSRWLGGEILEARDPNLGTEYIAEEMELVLKLGLMCSHSEPAARPSMRQVVQFLEGDVRLPDISPLRLSTSGLTFSHREGFDDFAIDDFANSYPSSMDKAFAHSSSVAESLLSGGR
uniref:non-specific serine/threonine protein kinase n=1 Tax=Populus trichocarpa TaxID=3694 RepID=A0A2K1R7D3_POPTR